VDKIHAKWGFGNAPLKTSHREKTEAAIRTVFAILEALPEAPTAEQLDAISHLKGQFTRAVKQDQWDWSTVWALLGRPSRARASTISETLGRLRAALKKGEREASEQAASELRATHIQRYCHNFLSGGYDPPKQGGTKGFIYILSTRAQPCILKIGVTQRTVEARVKEINSATGVIVPFGIRAVWKVDDAASVEREIHALFEPYRIREDREFFEIEFSQASRLINDLLGARRILRARHPANQRRPTNY